MVNRLYFYHAYIPLKHIWCFDKAGLGYHKYIKSIEDEGLKRPLSLFVYKDNLLQVCNGGSRYYILKYILKKPDHFKVPCLLTSIYDWRNKPIRKISYNDYQRISGYNYKLGYETFDTYSKLIFFEKKARGEWEGVERFVRENYVEKPEQLYKKLKKSSGRGKWWL